MNKDVFISLTLCLTLVMFIAVVSLWPDQETDNSSVNYMVIFTPDTPYEISFQRIVSAGGLPIRSGYFGNIILTKSNNNNYIENLKTDYRAIVLRSPIEGACITKNKSALSDI